MRAQQISERGYSLLKLLFGLVVSGFLLFHGVIVGGAYYTNYKVQRCFDLLVAVPGISVSDARQKLDDLFQSQYVSPEDLPESFYDQLTIDSTGGILEIASNYQLRFWLLGTASSANDQAATPGELTDAPGSLIGQMRRKTRIDLTFAPYAISANGDQGDN